jgi:hypothetical protein
MHRAAFAMGANAQCRIVHALFGMALLSGLCSAQSNSTNATNATNTSTLTTTPAPVPEPMSLDSDQLIIIIVLVIVLGGGGVGAGYYGVRRAGTRSSSTSSRKVSLSGLRNAFGFKSTKAEMDPQQQQHMFSEWGGGGGGGGAANSRYESVPTTECRAERGCCVPRLEATPEHFLRGLCQ